MAIAPPDLQNFRRRLDAIDEGLQDLLIERAEVVASVADHKRRDNVAFYQPGREAEIIRRLVARHRGPLPEASLVRIWREMLAASLSLEVPFAVAVYAPAGSSGFWDLARDHYGSNTPLAAYGSIGQVIRAVAEAQASVGVLPMPQEGESDPWWRHLLSQDLQIPRVIARLPFGPRGNARTPGTDALVIGHGAQQPTGCDRTLIATETAEISRARILGLLAALGLTCTFFASCDQIDGAVDLIELDSFVSLSDPRIESFRAQLGTALHRLLPLGGYAVPLPIAPPPPALPVSTNAAAGGSAI
jgi:chorismate mutase / prephenate dehydratase